jgi:hypothetical protein
VQIGVFLFSTLCATPPSFGYVDREKFYEIDWQGISTTSTKLQKELEKRMKSWYVSKQCPSYSLKIVRQQHSTTTERLDTLSTNHDTAHKVGRLLHRRSVHSAQRRARRIPTSSVFESDVCRRRRWRCACWMFDCAWCFSFSTSITTHKRAICSR